MVWRHGLLRAGFEGKAREEMLVILVDTLEWDSSALLMLKLCHAGDFVKGRLHRFFYIDLFCRSSEAALRLTDEGTLLPY